MKPSSPGEIIRRAREEQALSQKKLAEMTGLTPGYIARIEGDSLPSVAVTKALAKALHLDVNELWNAVEAARVEAEAVRIRTRSAMIGEPVRVRGVFRPRSIEEATPGPDDSTTAPADPEFAQALADLRTALRDETLRRTVIDSLAAFARLARARAHTPETDRED